MPRLPSIREVSMHTTSLRRLLVTVSTILLVIFSSLPSANAGQRVVETERIGHPIWRPVDCHLFSAPVGTAESGYAEYSETVASILPPPRHQPHPVLGIGPGSPHRPPYNKELARGVAAQEFREERRFSRREFSSGEGVFLACMVVPSPGARGSSPDFRYGKIIPNRLFPIAVDGAAFQRGRLFDPNFDFQVPALTAQLDPPFDVDGHSHFPVFFATNADFGPTGDLRGRYRYDIEMRDASGQGWRLQAYFVIGR